MDLQKEFEANARNPRVGSTLVSESDRVRVWHISLQPGERLAVHLHQADYFWTATSEGTGRAHFADGSAEEMAYHVGDTMHFTFGEGHRRSQSRPAARLGRSAAFGSGAPTSASRPLTEPSPTASRRCFRQQMLVELLEPFDHSFQRTDQVTLKPGDRVSLSDIQVGVAGAF